MILVSKSRNFLFKNRLLVLILVLSSLLRFIGTIPGYPPIHTDEGITHSQGIAMILEKTLDPKHGYGVQYNYPIMVPLINAFFYLFVFIPLYLGGYLLLNLGDWNHVLQGAIFEKNILGPNKINVVYWGRMVTALVGVGVVFLSYILGKRLFKSLGVGLLSAFLVGINYRQVLNSHFGLPDIYNAFFLLVALYFIVLLWEKQTWQRYVLAGLSAAVFFSTKFQFFALPPLAVVLIYLALQKKHWRQRLLFLVNKKIVLMLAVLIGSTLILNIFHLLHLSQTLEQVQYSALKYRYGRNMLDIYSLSYLYHIGVGPLASILTLIGIILGVLLYFRKMLFLLSVIVLFLWMMVYYTGGGYYTRNFITITPLLLICAGYAIWQIFKILQRYSPVTAILVGSILTLVVSHQSLMNAYLVPIEYSKSWNYTEVQLWLSNNLPKGAVVLTDATMVLPQKQLQVIHAKSIDDYSLKELQKKGIQWVVINTDWFSIDSLWWMQVDTVSGLKYWNKPIDLLSTSPTAKIMLELKNYIVFEALNPWQAPDNNYLVVKVPKEKENYPVKKSNFNLDEHLFLNSNGGM